MSDQVFKVCNVCNIGKSSDAFVAYNAHYAHKTCRDCEMPMKKKHKSNMAAVKSVSPYMSLELAAAAMIHHAAKIANEECAASNDQKKCRVCEVAKPISDFLIKDGVKRRSLTCKSCTNLNRRNNRVYPPKRQKICQDCGIAKPINEFYRSGRDLKCIKCRLDYNRRSRNWKLQNHTLATKHREIDHLVECIHKDVEAVESYVNALTIPSTTIVHVSTAEKKVSIVYDDDEFAGAPATESTNVRLSHSDSNMTAAITQTSCGLKKFDQIELIGVIAKVFHLEIIELKHVYPAEDINELSLWKSQVRELYAAQNSDADEAYRRIMFDYYRAARELKNNAARSAVD